MAPYPLKWRFVMLKFWGGGQRGIVLPIVLSFIAIFGLQIAGLFQYSAHTVRQIRTQEDYLKTFHTAEAVTERAVAQIKFHIQQFGTVPTPAELAVMANVQINTGSDYSYEDVSGNSTLAIANSGGLTTKVLTDGDYAGLNGTVQTVNITVVGRDTQANHPAAVSLTQAIEIQLIPIFQFGVFYQEDLEILPGPSMTFAGPVHSNASMYLGTNATLNFNSDLTAAGNIYHGRKDDPSAVMAGGVFIKDGGGTDQNMKNGDGTWLDSLHADWLLESQERWDGNVSSSFHGVSSLNLPLPTGSEPHALIERRDAGDSTQVQSQKIDYKAHLRIIDGAVTNQAGSSVELRYCSGGSVYTGSCPGGETIVNPITSTTFYNFREAKTITSTDIDVALLKSSPNFQSIASAANGVIVYVSDRRNQGSAVNQDAVRLKNGSSLPTQGLTVAAENPIYLKGDFNTVSKQPAGVVGDSFNVLSNAWNDAKSAMSLSNRTASNTTVNTTVIAGNTTTTPGNYNGGFENLPRFLEGWSGKTLTYSGSTIVLFNSQMATGGWIYGGNYYTAPNRAWSYDTALDDANYQIPGFPSVYNVAKTSFEHT